MTRRKLHELIDRLLEDAAANPDRVGELKQSLRARITAPDPTSRLIHASFAAAPALTNADFADDGLWDNVPV